jgi:hypothetical protein
VNIDIKYTVRLGLPVVLLSFFRGCLTGSGKVTDALLSDTSHLSATTRDSTFVEYLSAPSVKDSLLRTNDDLQIRFWLEYAFTSEIKLLIVKYNSDVWSAESMTLSYNSDTTLPSVAFERLLPKSGWRPVLKTLHENGVMSLPDQAYFNGAFDGECVTVEVKTTKRFRKYSYCCPRECSDAACVSMLNILGQLKRQFNVRIPCDE